MKVVILEDNISYSWDYEMIMEELGVQVLGVYKSWKEALPAIRKALPDFMIVDLYLDNNEKGLDFLKEMKDLFIPTIVCTGYPEKEYMDEALDMGVKAFLSKPFDKASLTFQIRKLIRELEGSIDAIEHLIIKEKRNLVKVPFKEIYKITIEGNYSFIFLLSNKRFVVKLSLKKLMEQLDEKQFLRCHRSTVVNLNHIESIDLKGNKILLSNKMDIELGITYKSFIRKSFIGS